MRRTGRADQCECRVCGCAATRLQWSIDSFHIVKCDDCSSLTTAHRPTAAQSEAFYGPSYFRGGDYSDYVGSEPTVKANFIRFAKRLSSIATRGRLLEVGCAYGYFLDVAQAYWEVEGVDISPQVVRYSQGRFPGRVHCGDLNRLALPLGCYQWVVAFDTIEHLNDPRGFVERAFALLAPGGRLAVTTGDVSSALAIIQGRRWRLLTPPSHLSFFSRDGMKRMLAASGYRDIAISTAGYSRTLDFVSYRILGHRVHSWIARRLPQLAAFASSHDFYVDLRDVMFVVARKPSNG
jgi:SAM-dependent methyltransferase